MTEQQAAANWLKTTLAASAGLVALLGTPPAGLTSSIYQDNAPEIATSPFLTFKFVMSDVDDTVGGQTTAMVNLVVQIDVVTEGRDWNVPQNALYQAHLAIQEGSGTVGGYKINCFRSSTTPPRAIFDKKDYRIVGGRYEIKVRPTIS